MLTLHQEKAFNEIKQRVLDKEKYTLFFGYAGTGKTYLLGKLFELMPTNKVRFVSFTGAAAQQMRLKGLPAQTIHSLIKKAIVDSRGNLLGFTNVPKEELWGIDLIVIDEISMVGKGLLNDLIAYQIPLLMVGDPKQLLPVGDDSNPYIFAKPHAFLEEVVRQAAESPIIWAATEIRNGRKIPIGVYGDQLRVLSKKDFDSSWLRRDVQFIAGLNKTRNKINLEIAGTSFPECGHKVIFLRNDPKKNIVNGTMADVEEFVNRGSFYFLSATLETGERVRAYKVSLEGEAVRNQKYIDNIAGYGYCLTAHKAQGRTINDPMVVIDESSFFRDQAEAWRYTAMTRAADKPVAWVV